MSKAIKNLFNIEYPVIQGGMIWVSGWKLASAVSNAGGLGLVGSGSMYPDVLREHIQKCKKATDKPFGVNVPMLYPQIEEIMNIIVEEGVKIVFTSAGNPKTWTSFLKEKGITVVHVVSSVKFALKAEAAGVDAVVCEGFEAGGHNGREETTTFTLIPMVKEVVKIPVIAAGGIATGRGMLAAMVLGVTVVNCLPRVSRDLFKIVGGFTPPIYVLFFVLVGAKLNLTYLGGVQQRSLTEINLLGEEIKLLDYIDDKDVYSVMGVAIDPIKNSIQNSISPMLGTCIQAIVNIQSIVNKGSILLTSIN